MEQNGGYYKMSYNPFFSGVKDVPSSQTLETSEVNNTGLTISKLTPVRINSSGDMATINVSIEAEALAIAGIASSEINDSDAGSIINSGRVKDITTAAVLGEILYVSKTGQTTNIKPAIGIGGFLADDFVIRLGVVAKNLANPSNKDLLVNISIVGQL